jgi:general secretion pathway protein G
VSEKIRKLLRGEKGFTLVEMMVVLIIIAVLIAGGIRYYLGYVSRGKITKATGDLTTIQAALESYYAQNNAYPEVGADLTAAGISPTMCTLTATTGVPYIYSPGGTDYSVVTASKLDGENYLTATGEEGNSAPITTTATP